ncbi:transglutaminase family protein [Pyruvatibacter sp.]
MRALSYTRRGDVEARRHQFSAGKQSMTPELDRILRAAGEAADDALDLAHTALALGAADMPDLVLDPYHAHLARIVSDVAARAKALETPDAQSADPTRREAARTRAQAQALADVIAGDFGYDGDRVTYDDMANANLVRVIDRKRGLPVALGLLYIHAGRANGWAVSGVNFPGHFLVRLNGVVQGGPPPVMIDPFSGGQVLDEDAITSLLARVQGLEDDQDDPSMADLERALAPVSARAVLLRLQNNIYSRASQARDLTRADAILSRMTAIAPRDPALWLERGSLDGETGSLMSARKAYARAAELALAEGRGQIAREAKSRADKLRMSLN